MKVEGLIARVFALLHLAILGVFFKQKEHLVGDALRKWWVMVDSNHQPIA